MRLEIDIEANNEQLELLEEYLSSMPIDVILYGLNFTYKRWKRDREGMLMVGRKSKIKKEVKMLTKEQARWRLDNWQLMVKNYREKGYSYPTISRIKKALMDIAR
ncbi:MAG: hypothetical protein KatS3mg003_2019 [Candidatus Nitrosocaldaceae archaeon]|nr:MAG: hypothetical protein KatS3mg003_2019 [Candidatus Nitrosocaldaceae archaeon]